MKWQVGDRVVCIADCPDGNDDIVEGVAGYVCYIDEDVVFGDRDIGVCWDERVGGGHDCKGSCEWGYGWFVYEHELGPEQVPDFDVATDDELRTLLGVGGG